MTFGNFRVVRVRGVGYDDNGDPIDGTARRVDLREVAFIPGASADITDRGRQGDTQAASLIAKTRLDLLHTDQVEVYLNGRTPALFDVDGDVSDWMSPFTGRYAGSQVSLTRAAG